MAARARPWQRQGRRGVHLWTLMLRPQMDACLTWKRRGSPAMAPAVRADDTVPFEVTGAGEIFAGLGWDGAGAS